MTASQAPAQTVPGVPSASDEGEVQPRLGPRALPLIIHAAFTLAAVAALVALDPVWGLRISGLIMATGCAALAVGEARRSGGIIVTPLSYMFAFGAISYGASSYSIANQIDGGERLGFSMYELSPESVAAGEAIYLIGFLALHLGMHLLRPRPRPATTSPRPAYFDTACLVLWTVGVLARLLHPNIGALTPLLGYGTASALTSYLLAHGTAQRRGAFFWIVLVLGTIVQLYLGITTGLKGAVMMSFLPAVWCLLIHRRLRVWIIPSALTLAILYLTIVAPIVTIARNRYFDMYAKNPVAAYEKVYANEDLGRESIADNLQASLSRQFNAFSTCFLYEEVARHGYRMGDTLDYVAYALVPRILWPEKPPVTRGQWFTVYLGEARIADATTTSIGMTAVGEFYWNFGVVGVVLGMLLVGALGGVLWRIAGADPVHDPIRMLAYYVLILADQQEAGTVIVAGIMNLIVFGVLTALIDRVVVRRRWGYRVPAT